MGGAHGRRWHWQRRGCQEWQPRWDQGHDWGVYSVPGQGSEGSSTRWEMLLPLQQSRTFYPWMPIGEGIQNSHPFKLKGGDGAREGSPDPSSQDSQAKGTPSGDAQGIGHHIQTPFLNPDPFHWWYVIKIVAWVRINRESCMAFLDNSAQINTTTLCFVESHSLEVEHPVRPSRQMSHLCRPRECTNLTHGLCYHMGSSGWSLGLWWRPNSPGDPRLVKLCCQGPHHPGDSHDKPHGKCDQGERDRFPDNTLGKCPGGLSFSCLMSYSHSGKWVDWCWGVRP